MEEIHNRQMGIIHPDKLQMPILIVGAGSIGSWTALALAKLGCSNITIMDEDKVEKHNAGSQIYKASDAGDEKVVSLIDKLLFFTDAPPFKGIGKHWRSDRLEDKEELMKYQIVIAAVDNITVRKELFEAMDEQEILYIDARMAGNALEIYTARMNNEEDCIAYEATLFAEEETIPVACSEKSVVYNVFIVAGLIGDLIAKHANKQELPKELQMDLYNLTLFK